MGSTDAVPGAERLRRHLPVGKAKPETTYDNFARDFGERFVPRYERPSTVDFLMNAPFEE